MFIIQVGIEVRWLETVDRDSVVATVDSNGEVLVSHDGIWSIVWGLERFPDSIMTDQHVCCC